MKNQVFIGLVCVLFSTQALGQYKIYGNVTEANGTALQGATVYLEKEGVGSISDEQGLFMINDVPRGEYELYISFVGYKDRNIKIEVQEDLYVGSFKMEAIAYQGEEVTISALRAGEKTPMAFTDLDRDEIVARNFGQDIPYIVSLTPSMVSSSDAGHGIGYTSMRIRGTDANRINVTINGIPLNDAESHSVFWVDLPELASSTENIQIQRGVGTSTNGAAAFGATVNLQTSLMEKEAYARYDATAGSFNTFRNTVSAGTGLIRNKYAVDMRISDLHSDGFIDRSWTDLQSYYLAAGYYGERSSLKFITFGGFEELYQSWGGVPSYLLSTNRTYNEMGLYRNAQGEELAYENQVDHYDQIHYQLHFSHALKSNLHLNAALHYTRGAGYYEQYEAGESYSYYGMIEPVIGSDTLSSTDLIRRKWLENDFYGAVASLSYTGDKSTLILGGGWNKYDGLHFGKVIWAEHFGNNQPGHIWYEGTGVKTDWNIYGKSYYYLSEKLTSFIDLQIRGIDHVIAGTDANNRNVDGTHSFLFFNPKAGLNYEPANGQKAFISFARASREPNRNNYTDAAAGMEPVQECLRDYEAGYSYKGKALFAGITLYYMDYRDQLVMTGQINEVGYPLMVNVKDSYRAGLEMEFGVNFLDKLSWSANLALSRNQINDHVNYIDNWDYWSDPENEPYQVIDSIGRSALAFSPSVIASSILNYNIVKGFSIGLISKYVGKQYIDNTANESYVIDPYFTNDLNFSYRIKPSWAESIHISILVPNLLDVEYETNAWLYRYYSGGAEDYMDGYFPQAGRHIMLNFSIQF